MNSQIVCQQSSRCNFCHSWNFHGNEYFHGISFYLVVVVFSHFASLSIYLSLFLSLSPHTYTLAQPYALAFPFSHTLLSTHSQTTIHTHRYIPFLPSSLFSLLLQDAFLDFTSDPITSQSFQLFPSSSFSCRHFSSIVGIEISSKKSKSATVSIIEKTSSSEDQAPRLFLNVTKPFSFENSGSWLHVKAFATPLFSDFRDEKKVLLQTVTSFLLHLYSNWRTSFLTIAMSSSLWVYRVKVLTALVRGYEDFHQMKTAIPNLFWVQTYISRNSQTFKFGWTPVGA